MRIDKTGAELHELDVHGVVHAGRVTLEIRTGTLKGSLLLIVVKTDIIGIVDTATTEVHTVVLTNARLEGFTEPVGVGIVHKMVFPVCTQTVTTGNRNTGILGGNAKILTVLLGICQVVDILLNLVYTEITFIIDLQRLFFLTVLGRDNHHTIGSTRTVDSTGRSILQHLDGLNVVRREITDGSAHGNTVDDVQRGLVSVQRTDTTDTDQRVGTRLTVRGDLHTGHLTFKHRRDIRMRHSLQFVGIHNRYRTSQVGLLLNTVTHNDHLIEHLGV